MTNSLRDSKYQIRQSLIKILTFLDLSEKLNLVTHHQPIKNSKPRYFQEILLRRNNSNPMQTFLGNRVEGIFPNSFYKDNITDNQTGQKCNCR